MIVCITLTVIGANAGPLFDLYQSSDGYTVPYATNITAEQLLGTYCHEVDDETRFIRIHSTGGVCPDVILEVVLCVTTTTSSSSSTTTTSTTCNSLKCDYGLLYNWYAVDTGKLAPTGWHVPTRTEWQTLVTYLGGDTVAGNKVKTPGNCDWINGNSGATNETGFTALPGGYRYSGFNNPNPDGWFWSTVASSADSGYNRELTSFNGTFYENGRFKYSGQSVRCIRDTNVGWVEGEVVTDYDGNEYDTVQIGTQIWTVQNLKTRHYNDGVEIPNVEDNTAWSNLVTGACCAYDNDWETYVCTGEAPPPYEPTTTSTTTIGDTTSTTTVEPTTTTSTTIEEITTTTTTISPP